MFILCCCRCADICGHSEYPCRFQNASAATEEIIPYRLFAPLNLKDACQETLLQLIPLCLSSAHSVLGTHPFSRLDVLIVPANFPSLGMARYVVCYDLGNMLWKFFDYLLSHTVRASIGLEWKDHSCSCLNNSLLLWGTVCASTAPFRYYGPNLISWKWKTYIVVLASNTVSLEW